MESPSRGNGVGTADHSIQPERYWTKPTAYCPNSPLPVLVYRGVFDPNVTVEEASKILQANHWIKGGVFKHYPAHHYHSNTHECYAAIRGNTKCVYGVGPLDDESDGVTFEMSAGDIAVHAAGVAHRNSESSLDYEYIGAYPEVGRERTSMSTVTTDAFSGGLATLGQQFLHSRAARYA